jgi:hypothetical protein
LRRGWPPLTRATLVAVVAVLVTVGGGATVLATAGCGSSPTHYTNAAYGFSLSIDPPFETWRTASTGAQAAFQVSFVDPHGAQAGGRHLDSLTVSVVKTGAAARSGPA